MNKRQTCGFLGWTAYEFDKAVAKGFPARKRNNSRGQDWQVDSREAVAWVVEQEVDKPRPRGGPTFGRGDGPPGPPPGYGVIERLGNPVDQGFMLAHLDAFYGLPALVASLAAGLGVPMGTVHELTRMVAMAYADQVGRDARKVGIEPWASARDPDLYELDAFVPINWPNLSRMRGEPGWTPPCHCCGWGEMTPEERADNVRCGEEIEARRAEEGQAAAVANP